jgi:hypothetical protein
MPLGGIIQESGIIKGSEMVLHVHFMKMVKREFNPLPAKEEL